MRHLTPTAQRASRKINLDMGDMPDDGIFTAIEKATGLPVRVEVYDNGPNEPLIFFSSSRTYLAEELDGWIDDRDEAGLRPLYDFDGIDRSTPDSEERFEDDFGSLPQWQDDEEAMASVYGRDE
jgi:hypothetical protein